MKTLRSYLFPLASTLGLAVLSSHALAAVYVCGDEECSTWDAITEVQLETKSTDGENTTIRQTLSLSASESITNGYNSIANTDLYLKKSLWHIGGIEPFKGKQHVTAYVYKSIDPDTRLKTCHAFSYKNPKGRYHATCDK
ncbi:hypothetical protein QL104_24790 [Pseudomonas piscis]|uniref:Uncharacterized protein n=1 Tax=Pseudomonas piscis TaxID=2614538 RepID=A0ABY9NDZ3_9PSED|nr:hypothetical protein [Pseudomonas piscis]WMN16540.1 hypothetical protein QL104_24790 [Pseudomonas piscis]